MKHIVKFGYKFSCVSTCVLRTLIIPVWPSSGTSRLAQQVKHLSAVQETGDRDPCSTFLGILFNSLNYLTYDMNKFQYILRLFPPVAL